MDTLVLQYDDRPIDEFKNLIKENENYCKKFNYDYKFLNSGVYENIPPYWRKVFLVKEYLNSYKCVLWIDTDAVIISHDSIDTLFKPDTHFAFSSNPSLFHLNVLDMLSAPMCAGVWAVKNTSEGKCIMNAWAKSYDPTTWVKKEDLLNSNLKNNNKFVWKASCIYGGICYEQGAFEIHILRTNNYNKWLSHWEHNVMNYLPLDDDKIKGFTCPPKVFALHYWTGNRNHIKKHF